MRRCFVLKKTTKYNDEGRIAISLSRDKKMVQIELDYESCTFLIEELNDILHGGIIEYDSDSGYSCGLLKKNSLGIIVSNIKE